MKTPCIMLTLLALVAGCRFDSPLSIERSTQRSATVAPETHDSNVNIYPDGYWYHFKLTPPPGERFPDTNRIDLFSGDLETREYWDGRTCARYGSLVIGRGVSHWTSPNRPETIESYGGGIIAKIQPQRIDVWLSYGMDAPINYSVGGIAGTVPIPDGGLGQSAIPFIPTCITLVGNCTMTTCDPEVWDKALGRQKREEP